MIRAIGLWQTKVEGEAEVRAEELALRRRGTRLLQQQLIVSDDVQLASGLQDAA